MISRCMFSNSCSLCISSIFRRVCKSMQWFKSIVASCTISVPFIIWLVTLLHNWIMYLPQEDRWAFHTDVRTYYQIIIFIICGHFYGKNSATGDFHLSLVTRKRIVTITCASHLLSVLTYTPLLWDWLRFAKKLQCPRDRLPTSNTSTNHRPTTG